MKSDALVRWYAHVNEPAPEEEWKRLLWMAAELVKRSQIERKTYRKLRGKRFRKGLERFPQEELEFGKEVIQDGMQRQGRQEELQLQGRQEGQMMKPSDI